MIRLTIVITKGNHGETFTPFELVMFNDETGNELESNYLAAVSPFGGFREPLPATCLPSDAVRQTRIIGHDRRTGLGPLLRKALEALT